mmetsp:Transcript_29582/g.45162  ORF Transcript_29582/g.45162 Transcript_29582/m.45162 type:complete len:229 (+) Transcript_29582:440-1126(+)
MGRPNARHTKVAITALIARIPTTVEAITPGIAMIILRSTSNPTVKKNNPTSIPRKGDASTSTWCRCFVSAMSIPLRKAPSVLLSPNPSVKNDIPRTVANITPMNDSTDPLAATKSNMGPRRVFPNSPIADKAIVICTKALATASLGLAPFPARMGVMTSKGTTIKSCNKSVPKDDFPYCDSISSLSFNNCNTNAELLNAKLHPMIIMAAVENPRYLQMAAMTPAVIVN